MSEEEKRKQVDDAVRVFRETLEGTYLRSESTMELHGIGVHTLSTFLSGKVNFHRKKDGNLRISGEIPSVAIKDSVSGLPMKVGDWSIFPIVITLFHEKHEEERVAE